MLCTECYGMPWRVEGDVCVCGMPASPDSVGKNSLVANRHGGTDKRKDYAGRPLRRVTCECGKRFQQIQSTQKHCSTKCRNKASHEARRRRDLETGVAA